MTFDRRQGGTLALGALALMLACGALILVGGPETARAERRDDARIDMIREIARCLGDLPQAARDALPDTARAEMDCAPGARWKDPATGEPYRIEKRGAGRVAVCAQFEMPDRLGYAYGGQLEHDTGCFVAH